MATAIRQLPARLPLSLSAGDDFAFTLTVAENGTPYVWTGATVEAVLVGYTVAAFSADTSTAGTLILSLTEAQTATAGIFGWYLRVTKSGGSRTWCAGTVHVSPATDGGTSSSAATLAITTAGAVALAITVGTAGPAGPAGSGLAAGGTTGQVLAKNSNTDYDTEWITAAGLGDMIAANNLSDLTDASTARTNLGLGTAATTAATAYATAAQGSTADTAMQPATIGVTVQGYSAVLAATTASFLIADETKLDGIEAGATADQSAAEILAALLTVDGAGSGLDADLLDGNSAAAFATAAHAHAGVYEAVGVAAALVDDLSGVTNAATARTNLGLGTAATTAAADYATAAQGTLADAALPKVAGGASVENLGAVESNVQTVAATGATETLDTSVYGVFDCTMDQACTFTFSNPAPSGKLSSFVLILRGAFTPTLPASVDWADATPPTYTTPSVYIFTTVDAGTTWLGAQVGKAFG